MEDWIDSTNYFTKQTRCIELRVLRFFQLSFYSLLVYSRSRWACIILITSSVVNCGHWKKMNFCEFFTSKNTQWRALLVTFEYRCSMFVNIPAIHMIPVYSPRFERFVKYLSSHDIDTVLMFICILTYC